MPRLKAVILLCLYLSVNTEIHQLFRLPILIQHIARHQKQNTDTSILELLTEHYFKNTTDNDAEHRELPFKNHDCHETSGTQFFVPLHEINTARLSFFISSPKPYIVELLPSSFSHSIWQPPRA